MSEDKGLEAVCRLIGMVSEHSYPVEFRLAAIGLAIVSILVIVDYAMDYFS